MTIMVCYESPRCSMLPTTEETTGEWRRQLPGGDLATNINIGAGPPRGAASSGRPVGETEGQYGGSRDR